MRFVSHKYAFIGFVLLLSSCQIRLYRPESAQGPNLYLSVQSFGMDRVLVQNSAAELSQIPSGRTQCFQIEDEEGLRQPLSCDNLDSTMYVEFDALCVVGVINPNLTPSASCRSGNTQITLHLSFSSSNFTIATESRIRGSNTTDYAFTRDGRYVVLNNPGLYAKGMAYSQMVRHDRATGKKRLVSTPDGVTLSNSTYSATSSASISEDGNLIAFASNATNLISGVSGTQIFLKNLTSGALSLMSVSSDGLNVGNGTSISPHISANGQYVVFSSTSSNLMGGISGTQIYRKNISSGTIELISTPDNVIVGNGFSTTPKISSTGRYVAFVSTSSNLVSVSAVEQIYLRDTQLNTIALVSSTNGVIVGNNSSFYPSLSDDGNYVTFYSIASNFGFGAAGYQVYRRNITGNTLELVSSTNGITPATDSCLNPMMTPDGRYIAFEGQWANGLIPTIVGYHVYRKDMQTNTITFASTPDGITEGSAAAQYPSITSDGNSVAFISYSNNLIPSTYGFQIYVKNLSSGSMTLGSPAEGRTSHNSIVTDTSISPDGNKVSFSSFANNVSPIYASRNLYIKNLISGSVTLASTTNGTTPMTGPCVNGSLSTDARYIAFYCADGQVYHRDMDLNVTTLISSPDGTTLGDNSSGPVSLSADGRYVVFSSNATNILGGVSGYQVYRRDMTLSTPELVSTPTGVILSNNTVNQTVKVSSNGRYVVFASNASNLMAASGTQIYRKDMTGGTIELVSSPDGVVVGSGTSSNPSISADGNFIAFRSTAGNLVGTVSGTQVYLKNMQLNSMTLVSSPDGITGGTGTSQSAAVSSDGDYVSFTSNSTNITTAPLGGVTQVFRKKISTGAITLISYLDALTPCDATINESAMSSDGKTVVFRGNGKNLIGGISGNHMFVTRVN